MRGVAGQLVRTLYRTTKHGQPLQQLDPFDIDRSSSWKIIRNRRAIVLHSKRELHIILLDGNRSPNRQHLAKNRLHFLRHYSFYRETLFSDSQNSTETEQHGSRLNILLRTAFIFCVITVMGYAVADAVLWKRWSAGAWPLVTTGRLLVLVRTGWIQSVVSCRSCAISSGCNLVLVGEVRISPQ
ncbi:hypothetical protein NE237_025918 [Protea cynaroides]|uniref:Uncharacterized protein n=1 Tax=Protea cynaroides TaxID=273540 RepID=A0A9Q0H2S8_9MAGN|nr:hypothetical protein NE237_025918 [Protea cynaroides]